MAPESKQCGTDATTRATLRLEMKMAESPSDNESNSNRAEKNRAEKSKPDPEAMGKELVGSINEFEKAFKKEYPYYWWASLLAPALVTVAILVTTGILAQEGWQYSLKIIFNCFITFCALGRFVICYPAFLAGAEEGETLLPEWLSGLESYLNLTTMDLFWMVTYMDIMVAIFVTFHMGLMFKIPWLGPKIAMLVWDGKFVMDSQPWLRKLSFFGLVVFVIFPTSTTGSIGGSIFGRLLGLSRARTIAGVFVGSLLGNGLMVAFGEFINAYVKDSIWLKVLGVVILIAAMVFLERRYSAAKKRYLEDEGIDEDALDEEFLDGESA